MEEDIDSKKGRLTTLQRDYDTLVVRVSEPTHPLSNHLVQSKEQDADRRVAKESKSMEKIHSKRSLLVQKKEDCQRRIVDLGAVPTGIQRWHLQVCGVR